MPPAPTTTSTHNANGNQAPNGVGITRPVGNVTHTLTYDAENRLVSVSGSGMTASFVYDGDGNRVQSTINGVTTVYIGNYYEKSGDNITKYYYAGAMRIAMKSDSGTTWLLGDHLGSTSLAVNGATGQESSEQRYMPFGEVRYTSSALPTKYTFTGQYSNVSDFGLMYYGARWYDVSLGRFASADTIIPGAGNPQSWDRYAYINNNPVNGRDPTGHWVESLLDLASIGYDAYDIASNGLNWENGLSLAADVASLALPVVTGGGLAVRALMHADDAADVVRAANAAQNVAQAANQVDNAVDASRVTNGSTLFHYTNEKGLTGIVNSNEIIPSLKSVNPKDVRYGEGQYLTDLVPGSMTPNQLSRQLVGNPFQGSKYTHYVEIDVQGLTVIQGRPNVFVVPNTKPLDITNRIINFGEVIAK